MKKFQQLLSDQSENEYGLQYRAIKPTKNLLRNIQNSYEPRLAQNPQTIEVYLKSSQSKSLKMKLFKRSKIEKLKQTVEQKLSIPFQDQLIYLNGKQISIFSSITLNQKQIIHITDRKNIVGLYQPFLISLKVLAPKDFGFDGKVYEFILSGGDKISVLKSLLLNHDDFRNFDQRFQFNFLQSGRIMNRQESFTQNLITKNCDMICLISENSVETKFANQCQQIDPQETIAYKRIETSPKKVIKPNYEPNQGQIHYGGLKFNKPRATSNKFLIGKGKSPIYSKIFKTTQDSSNKNLGSNQNIRQIDSEAQKTGSGFKKKKTYQEDHQSDESHLIKKIVVRKSREEVQKMAQNSLIKQEVNEVEEEKKSVVSSSSQEEDQKIYVPIRQQKEYRPCPLIPQRKMAPSQKIKINMELQKLFGGNPGNQESRYNMLQSNEDENDQQSPAEVPIETTTSRVIIKNSGMRNSIGGKDSILRIVKDRKPSNRYGQENTQEGD